MSSAGNRWESYSDALRLTESEYCALVAARQRSQQGRPDTRKNAPIANTRIHRRVCVQGTSWLPVEFREAGGEIHRLKSYPLDLSGSGACLLADRFLHKQTTCVVTLHLADGELFQVTGKVIRCEHLQGRAHELGVEFDELLDLGLIIDCVESSAMSPASGSIVETSVEATGAMKLAPQASDAQKATRLTAMSGELRAVSERLSALRHDADRLNTLAKELSSSAAA